MRGMQVLKDEDILPYTEVEERTINTVNMKIEYIIAKCAEEEKGMISGGQENH